MPSRDYYLNKTDKNVVLEAYLIYMIKVAELMGGTNVDETMRDVLEFEKKLASVSTKLTQLLPDFRIPNPFLGDISSRRKSLPDS